MRYFLAGALAVMLCVSSAYAGGASSSRNETMTAAKGGNGKAATAIANTQTRARCVEGCLRRGYSQENCTTASCPVGRCFYLAAQNPYCIK